MKRLLAVLGLLITATAVHAQNYRVDFSATTISSYGSAQSRSVQVPLLALPNASVSFYSCAGAAAFSCTTPLNTFPSATATLACPITTQVVLQGTGTCVANADAQGNFGTWVPVSGMYGYAYTFYVNGKTYGPFQFTVGGGGGGSVTQKVNYGQTFTNATTVILLDSSHLLNTTNIIPQCYDSAGNALAMSHIPLKVNQTTFDVTLTFAQPQTGYCALNGSGGSGGSNATVSGDINPTGYPGGDLCAQLVAAITAKCTSGCTMTVPPGVYQLASGCTISTPKVHVRGYGVTPIGASGVYAMMQLNGDEDSVEGFDFNQGATASNASVYSIIASNGKGQQITRNAFSGFGGVSVTASNSPGAMLINENSFDGNAGCATQAPIVVFNSAYVQVSNNRLKNTCGFGVQVLASKGTLVHGNSISQLRQDQSVVATSGQTSFVFNWDSTKPQVRRVWVQVNGVPTSTGVSVAYTSANVTTATFATAPTAGATVTGMGWTALENIQVTSQSFDTVVSGNIINGTGDSAIDVVSDFHAVSLGTATATQNQSVFNITASATPLSSVLAEINNRILTPDAASITNVGSAYTVTLVTPRKAGTVVTLVDFQNYPPGSTINDYPAGVTIQNNAVADAAASGIAVEVGAPSIVIQGNVLRDNALGLDTPSYSSGIFTGNSPKIVVKNNTFINARAVPTMRAGVEVQEINLDTGSFDKPALIGGSICQGTFSAGCTDIPVFQYSLQSGIDVTDMPVISYSEAPNFDIPFAAVPVNTRYFSYALNGASGLTRSTTNVIGGLASAIITSGSYVDVVPTNQIFFTNSIVKVSFWARNISGSPRAVIFADYLGQSPAAAIAITSTSWQQYSIYAANGLGLTNLRFRIDGQFGSGSMAIQNITFAATPWVSGPTTATGTSSTASALIPVQPLTVAPTGGCVGYVDQNGGQNPGLCGATFATPASSSAACTVPQVEYDASYVYTCVATNSWRRVAQVTF